MCLFTKGKEGQVSDKPVVCYKYYVRRPGCLRSPYVRVEYEIKPGDEVVAEGKAMFKRRLEDPVGYYSVGEGVIHGCRQMEDLYHRLFWECGYGLYKMMCRAVDFDNWDSVDWRMDEYLEETSERYALCEMEIPAGERYWVGENGDVCAKRMVFKKEIKLESKFEVADLVYSYYLATVEKEKMWETEGGWKFVFDRYKEEGE